MLIVMAGLPGTGKSTLATALARECGGVVLNKDSVRAALFPPGVLDYSREQDDLCMHAIYQATSLILKKTPEKTVLLDGRTFLRAYQIREVTALAESLGEPLRIIECVADDDMVRHRLASDTDRGADPAANRNYALYLSLKEAAEPIALPRLVLDTGKLSLSECVRRCLGDVRIASESS